MSMQNIFLRNAHNFRGNINVVPSSMAKMNDKHYSKRLVILGTKQAILNQRFLDAFPPHLHSHRDTICHCIRETQCKKSSTFHLPMLHAETEKFVKVTIGIIPEECSRYNCPTRPDIITNLVKGMAIKATEKDENDVSTQGSIDMRFAVQVGDSSSEMTYRSITCAVAKSFSQFTTKKRSLEGDFLDESALVKVNLLIINSDEKTHEISLELAHKLNVIAESCQMCMFLVDAPPNLLTTMVFANIVSELSKIYDYKIHTKIVGDDLCDVGLTGIFNVGKAAGKECPPIFIVLENNFQSAEDDSSLALVGKGITYDSGGLALKPAASMVNMKMDMAGASLVFSTFVSLVRNKTPKKVYAVLCLAENAIGHLSYRNDDIIPLHSGLNVEINNTDAEGRIVLSDGISFASQKLNPRHVFTFATLTGAQSYATGVKHCGVYVNTKALEDTCVEEGKRSGDLVFPLIYCPEFLDEEFTSEVADMKNSVKNRNNASSSAAGRFLERSLTKEYSGGFMHFDIAAPAFQKDRATGFGINLLYNLVENL